jgi:hypothetical protein
MYFRSLSELDMRGFGLYYGARVFFSFLPQKSKSKKYSYKNYKRTEREFNLELIVKGQQTWEYSGENKCNFEFFGPQTSKSDLNI